MSYRIIHLLIDYGTRYQGMIQRGMTCGIISYGRAPIIALYCCVVRERAGSSGYLVSPIMSAIVIFSDTSPSSQVPKNLESSRTYCCITSKGKFVNLLLLPATCYRTDRSSPKMHKHLPLSARDHRKGHGYGAIVER